MNNLEFIQKELEKYSNDFFEKNENGYWIYEYNNSDKCIIDFKLKPTRVEMRFILKYVPGKAEVYKNIRLNLENVETLQYKDAGEYPEVLDNISTFLEEKFGDKQKERW